MTGLRAKPGKSSIVDTIAGAAALGGMIAVIYGLARNYFPAGPTPPPVTPPPVTPAPPPPPPPPPPVRTHPYYTVGQRLENASGNHILIVNIVSPYYELLDEDGALGNQGLTFYYDYTALDLNPSWWTV